MTQCLIVDACKAERDRIQGMLRPYEFDLLEASDAGEALARCGDDMPDVIMLSESLADMDAFDFIKRVRRAREGEAPVVLVYSDDADPSHIGRVIWEGANECMMQPFDAEVLDGKLRQVGLL